MKILKKESDDILVIASPREMVRVGDYLVATETQRSLVLQVYDERYLDVEGIEEEIAREEVLSASAPGVTSDPTELTTISTLIRDMRILLCKARGTISGGKLTPRANWMPSRASSTVTRLLIEDLAGTVAPLGVRDIRLGTVDGESSFAVPAEALDGRITVITGRKESGKSHLAKILLRGLLENGAYSVVFDLNDEYGTVGQLSDGTDAGQGRKVNVMRPGRDLKFSLASMGLRPITSLLSHSLEMPGTSLREFVKIWEQLDKRDELSLASLEAAIQQWRCNEFVRDALFARYHTLASCGLFTDSSHQQFDLQDFFNLNRSGGSLVVSLSGVSPLNRKMVVELILSKLVELLERRKIPPVFLFAEEAHLYLRDTYWEDLITRMRHFGVFTVFVTNQPDAIDQKIYRQVDNIFLYNFSNDSDLALVSQASMADADTVKAIVRTLPPRMCLLLGYAVRNLPVVVSVDPFDSPASGTTRRFFADPIEVGPAAR
ncbi:MAG: ATP-binding protein [Nitrososphaerota archaeon]|nr:ATP-binding protein [Nitrososphaerota archaeon]MDG6961500.1 ATP-binding protein [Nitrososphaerota archaeon]MDG7015222.1 ATP-binding protein [Nitrososphaerota archaeon]WGO49980.1 MAG: ATP-binding protein [Nitrososphaerota archaeon]